MSAITDVLDCDEDRKLQNNGPVHINDLKTEEAEAIRKVIAQLPHEIIAQNLPPTFSTTPLSGVEVSKINLDELKAQTERLEESSSDLSMVNAQLANIEARSKNQEPPDELDFPNLAWEAIKAGLLKEKITNEQLNRHISDIQKHQEDIDLLLKFSTGLAQHKKEGKTEMSQELQGHLFQLKERGFDFGEDISLNDEKTSELRMLSSEQIDNLRAKLQSIFTTKIQHLMQLIGTIIEILKDIIRNNRKIIDAANRLPGRG